MTIFTRVWWDAAGTRAANTAIAALLTLAVLLVGGDVTPLYVLEVVAVAALASLVTSMAGIPEVTGKVVPLWRAILVRSVKTFGQMLAAALVGAVTLSDVAWQTVAIAVAGAVLTTVLRTLRDYLPETEPAPAVGGTAGVPAITALPPTT
jgi:hypothetical protein